MRKRILHFLIGGLALFFADWMWSEPGSRFELGDELRDEPIVITEARISQLRKNFKAARGAGGRLTAEEHELLVARAIDEEILYREALARGMHLSDRSIRYRMIQKMRFVAGHDTELSEDELYERAADLGLDRDDAIIRRLITEKVKLLIKFGTPMAEPGDAEIEEFISRSEERYTQPATITFSQIYFSNDAHGDRAEEEALGALREMSGVSREEGEQESRGERFAWGDRFEKRSPQSLERLLGTDFADAVMEQPVGVWAGPVASSFGYHLVFIDERTDARIAELEEVRRQARMALITEKREARFEQVMHDLRGRYEVEVRADAGTSGSDTQVAERGVPE